VRRGRRHASGDSACVYRARGEVKAGARAERGGEREREKID